MSTGDGAATTTGALRNEPATEIRKKCSKKTQNWETCVFIDYKKSAVSLNY
jgi:hypothetical protein